MRKIKFFVSGSVMRASDAAYLVGDEDPREAVIEAAVQHISTTVEIKVGEVAMHLAAWMDPDHWEEDWREKGINPDDVDALLAAAVHEEAPANA